MSGLVDHRWKWSPSRIDDAWDCSEGTFGGHNCYKVIEYGGLMLHVFEDYAAKNR